MGMATSRLLPQQARDWDPPTPSALAKEEEEEEKMGEEQDKEKKQEEEETPHGQATPRTSSMKRKTPPTTDLLVPDSKRKAWVAEMQLEERSAAFRYLWWQMVQLHAEWPDLPLKEAFLKMDDAEARKLDDKLRMQRMAELDLFCSRMEIRKDVNELLNDFLD